MATLAMNVKYKPMSFEERLRPFLMYDQAYKENLNNINTLADAASKYSAYIDPNSKAYSDYKNYTQQLKDTASYFQQNGMDMNHNANMIVGLRNQYRDTMIPINNAALTLASYAKQGQEMQAKGLVQYNTPTIDELVADPTKAPKYLNPQEIYKRAATASQTASARVFDIAYNTLNPLQKEVVKKQGWDAETASAILNSPEMQKITQQILTASGVNVNELPSDIANIATNAVLSGYTDGYIYKEDRSIMTDEYAKSNLNFTHQLALQKLALQRKEAKSAADSGFSTGIYHQPVNSSDPTQSVRTVAMSAPNEKLNNAMTSLLSQNIKFSKNRDYNRIDRKTGERYDKWGAFNDKLNQGYLDDGVTNYGYNPKTGKFMIETGGTDWWQLSANEISPDLKYAIDANINNWKAKFAKARQESAELANATDDYLFEQATNGMSGYSTFQDYVNDVPLLTLNSFLRDKPQAKGDTSEKN